MCVVRAYLVVRRLEVNRVVVELPLHLRLERIFVLDHAVHLELRVPEQFLGHVFQTHAVQEAAHDALDVDRRGVPQEPPREHLPPGEQPAVPARLC